MGIVQRYKAYLKRRFPEPHWLRRCYRWGRTLYGAVDYYVVLLEPRPNWHWTGKFTAEEVDEATVRANYEAGRLTRSQAGKLLAALNIGSVVVGVLDGERRLEGWSILARGNRKFENNGVKIEAGAYSYIHDTMVLEGFRGQGRGAALNAAVLERLADGEKAFALVRCNNLPAMRAWARCDRKPLLQIKCRRWWHGSWTHAIR